MSDTLMVGVSGVRGIVGKDLTEDVVTRYATAFGLWAGERKPLVVVGRDARKSGPAFETAVVAGLASVGCDVVKVGLAPTPTIQLAVEHPERVSHLILDGTSARWLRSPDYPAGLPAGVAERFVEMLHDTWGTGSSLELFALTRIFRDKYLSHVLPHYLINHLNPTLQVE